MLVAYPHEDDVEDASTAMLTALCEAPSGDDRAMPRETIDSINDATRAGASEGLKDVATYEAGADVVTREIARFAPLFEGRGR